MVLFYTVSIMTMERYSDIVRSERKSGPKCPRKGRDSDEHNYDFCLS